MLRTMKVHLVDGTYELFRSFYGAPAAQHDGREIAATRAILRSFWNLLQQPGVTHVAVAFDTVIESFRNELFAGYKTGDGIDPALWAQFPLAEQAAEGLGLVTWRMIDFECDDALATAAMRFAEDARVSQVVITSPDKDFAQCVRGEHVVGWDRLRGNVLDEPGVHTKFGIGPASIPDWLALVGDTADGIPGLTGWGPKSASTVLARWGRIEAIPADPAQWEVPVRGAARLAATLQEEMEDALLYRRLATLRFDVPLTESLDDLAWRGPNLARLEPLCASIGDTDFLERARAWVPPPLPS